MVLLVAADGLAQFFHGAGDIQNIVLDLKRNANVVCTSLHLPDLLLVCTGQDSPAIMAAWISAAVLCSWINKSCSMDTCSASSAWISAVCPPIMP